MDSSIAGMLRGWVMLWSMEATWLLAGTVIAAGIGALIEVLAAISNRRQ